MRRRTEGFTACNDSGGRESASTGGEKQASGRVSVWAWAFVHTSPRPAPCPYLVRHGCDCALERIALLESRWLVAHFFDVWLRQLATLPKLASVRSGAAAGHEALAVRCLVPCDEAANFSYEPTSMSSELSNSVF